MKRILIIFAHPGYYRSHANRAMLKALKGLEAVKVHDLCQHYPNMFIDVAREQRMLREYDIIIFQHPFYWYSCPSILKEWMDQVLEYGYAFGPDGNALRHKYLLSAVTTGGSALSYSHEGHNHRPITDYLLPFQQSGLMCGMRWLPPFVVYGYHSMRDPDYLKTKGQQYRKLLTALSEEKFTPEQLCNATYLTDLLEAL